MEEKWWLRTCVSPRSYPTRRRANTCEDCERKRYNNETLEIKFKGLNIAEVLDLSVEEARAFFKNIFSIKKRLDTLSDVGLGYIKLGQQATTLSGGEAQRVKLSTELSKTSTKNTVYFLSFMC